MASKTLSLSIQKRKFGTAPYRDSWHEFEAFDGERLIGRLICFEAPRGSKDCWLHDLWVDPGYRRSGVGSKLIVQAVATAREHKYLRMLGEFRPYDRVSQKAVQGFFRRHGFNIDENWDGKGRAVVLLVLT